MLWSFSQHSKFSFPSLERTDNVYSPLTTEGRSHLRIHRGMGDGPLCGLYAGSSRWLQIELNCSVNKSNFLFVSLRFREGFYHILQNSVLKHYTREEASQLKEQHTQIWFVFVYIDLDMCDFISSVKQQMSQR